MQPIAIAFALASLASLASLGCFGSELEVGHSSGAVLVSDYITTSCSTAPTVPLSMQIAEEVSCMAPDALTAFTEKDGIVFAGSAVIPYATPAAARDLEAAAAAGGEIRINSAYRTVVQQYLLYEWYLRGRCGITAAAVPGRSNHESGRAIDVGNYTAARAALNGAGWAQTVLPNDPVHFDHLDSPDLRGTDVLAFQRLWNRNNPSSAIDEDGAYGPMTASALRNSPAEGFADAGCAASELGGELIALDGPAQLRVGDRDSIVIRLRNSGESTWPAGVALATAMPSTRDSVLYDEETWESARVITTLTSDLEPGAEIEIEFTLLAAVDVGAASMTETLQLSTADGLAFGPLIRFDVEIIGVSGDGDGDRGGVAGNLGGGCSSSGAGGNAPMTAWLALAGLVLYRHRRRHRHRRSCRSRIS